MRGRAGVARVRPTNNEIRTAMLEYFYDRNRNATSDTGKKGRAVKISDVRGDLKAAHGFTAPEVQSNLTYLESQGWIGTKVVQKQFTTTKGTVVPSPTTYYIITAAGIDKIEGEGEFTMRKFHGININATGQNIITLGDGNEINAEFGELGKALVELRDAIAKSDAGDQDKLSHVADIDTIQNQLAKPAPNRTIIRAAWETVKAAASIDGCANLVIKVSGLIGAVLA